MYFAFDLIIIWYDDDGTFIHFCSFVATETFVGEVKQIQTKAEVLTRSIKVLVIYVHKICIYGTFLLYDCQMELLVVREQTSYVLYASQRWVLYNCLS